MFLKSLEIRNLLSFGADTPALKMGNLTIFIGPNGSGKSNFIETLGLLKAAPRNFSAPVKESGGVREWLHKPFVAHDMSVAREATINAVLNIRVNSKPVGVRHVLTFAEHGMRFEVMDETIACPTKKAGASQPYFYYKYQRGAPVLNIAQEKEERKLQRESIRPEESILSQRRDPEMYPELAALSDQYEQIAIFRDWTFGRYAPPRVEQRTDLPGEYLSGISDNLALVLNQFSAKMRGKIVEEMQKIYPALDSIETKLVGSRLQVFFNEGEREIPATRLSDGTLRYLCILVALLHPSLPPLICWDEPELGLHPDAISALADVIKDASERTQIVITTHSERLVDAFSDRPECVVPVEQEEGQTVMRHLDATRLKAWLEDYSLKENGLGEAWNSGEIGATL